MARFKRTSLDKIQYTTVEINIVYETATTTSAWSGMAKKVTNAPPRTGAPLS